MTAKNQSGELADVQAAIHLQRTNDGEHYMASFYALDDYQKIEAQLKQGHLIYSKYTKEDLEANNGALDPKVNASSTLVRLLTSLGRSNGNATTEADIVKNYPHNRENATFSLTNLRRSAQLVTDGELRTHGLEGLSKEEAKKHAFEQAKENIPLLKKLVAAAAKAAGGEVKMRPANKENGQETKAPSTAFSKAERDYGGDISRVVDLIGGTCVLNKNSSYADAVEAIRSSLPEGCSIAKVKKLGFGGSEPCYQDVKVQGGEYKKETSGI